MNKLYRFKETEPVLNWCGVIAALAIYPLYMYVFPLLAQLGLARFYVFQNKGASPEQIYGFLSDSTVGINLISYGLTALLIFIFFGGFIINSAKSFVKNLDAKIFYVPILGAIVTYMGNILASLITMSLVGGNQSANNEAAVSMISQSPGSMILLTVILAPLCEELIFRAAIFRPLYHKCKLPAIILTVLLFGLHHVWQAALTGDLTQLVYIIQYIPSSAALVFCYCMFDNYFGSVIMHMLLNGISTALILMMNALEGLL